MSLITRLSRLLEYRKLQRNNVFVDTTTNIEKTTWGGNNKVYSDNFILQSDVGIGTYIRENCIFKKAKIGAYCSIAPRVKMIYGEHPTSKFVSTHPTTYKKRQIANLTFGHEAEFKEYRETDNFLIQIGNDVWICSDVLLLEGITIGNGAIIAAGSVVTKDVPPYAIVGGNPAKVLKYRFSSDQIRKLEEIKWWEKDKEWIANHIQLFDDVDLFFKEIKM